MKKERKGAIKAYLKAHEKSSKGAIKALHKKGGVTTIC